MTTYRDPKVLNPERLSYTDPKISAGSPPTEQLLSR